MRNTGLLTAPDGAKPIGPNIPETRGMSAIGFQARRGSAAPAVARSGAAVEQGLEANTASTYRRRPALQGIRGRVPGHVAADDLSVANGAKARRGIRLLSQNRSDAAEMIRQRVDGIISQVDRGDYACAQAELFLKQWIRTPDDVGVSEGLLARAEDHMALVFGALTKLPPDGTKAMEQLALTRELFE